MTTTAPAPAKGLTFCPQPNELTDLYLHRKITGEDLPDGTSPFIHVADVYSAEPDKLTEAFEEAPGTGKGVHKQPVWYFFSPVRYVGGRKTNAHGGARRKSRTIDSEAGNDKHWWHSEKGELPVKGGSDYGGYEQYFSYKVKNASSGKEERPGWIMMEYGISPEHGGGDLVLCMIHRSPRAVAPEASMPAAEQVSDPVVNTRKRKAPAGDHPEDPTASARPRHTDNHDEHLESDLTWVDAAEQHREMYGAAGLIDHQPADQDGLPPLGIFFQNMEQDFESLYLQHNDVGMAGPGAGGGDLAAAEQHRQSGDGIVSPVDLMADFEMNFPELFGGERVTEELPEMYGAAGFDFADNQPTGQAVPPSNNFFQNVEQDFRSFDQNGVASFAASHQPTDQGIWSLEHICGLVAPPCAAAGLVQTITVDEVPRQNYNDGQTEASFGEEQVVYGLPCPAFSPEMIQRMCSNDVMMPWRSSSSTTMTNGLY